MNYKIKVAAGCIAAASLLGVSALARGAEPPTKKHTSKANTPAPPSVEDQINALRQEMQNQIDSLKSSLAEKDAALQQAQQAAAQAQAAAAKAQQAVDAQQQSYSDNQSAVTKLQSTVGDLKANQASLASTISDETTAIKKEVSSPDSIHYKGITISPAGSFLAAETDWRSAATGGGLNTAFTGVPLQNSQAYQFSEFGGTGRQSRIAIKAQGKLANMVLTGYYEMDWLGTGITSNNNQSNSYVVRQRQLWADAALSNGWDFSGGQGWSLATETTKGLIRGTEILPATIDPQYEAGFVWTRQYSFRVTKSINNKIFMGASVENAQTLNPAGQNLPSNYVFGSTGTGGGLYNPTANYSFNYTPDFVAKIAAEPGWGHWELFGIGRSFRDRIYPTTGTPQNNVVWGGGVGGGFRGPVVSNRKAFVYLKGLYGQGVGRYGSSTIADVTVRPDGSLSPLHGFSGLSGVELDPNKRLMIYIDYGGDYIGRDLTMSNGKEVGYGTYTADMSGCSTEPATAGSAGASGGAQIAPAHCTANNKDVQEFTAGYWYDIYSGPKGRLRQGLQYSWIRRDLWSGAGSASNPNGGAFGDDNMVFTSFRYYLP
ncbi:MAG: hypothetical protein ACLGP3_11155 [Acidobacteriota bacterium]